MATKKYEGMRIMSLEGSVLYKNEGFTATKDGKPDPQAFRGILDESLDTLKLAEVYARHERDIGYPYLEGDHNYCRAIVNVSFERAVKVFEPCGNRYVRNGYAVTDEDMQDHACVCMVNGRPTLIAIEVSYKERKDYLPVEFPVSQELLGKYFKYDADTRSYKRSDKTIPTDITCLEIREYLYTYGFDIDGVHYVRYKRSAGASRDGRCLFIAEPLYADMMEWSSCGLSADTVSDQASWQAYIALTLSSIENVIKLPKKSILIIRDRVSRFTENVVCVKETDGHDLKAEEEETEIENVIWDGEALLEAEIFNENGYGGHGMMLLRNRFFKTCAFNTNLQDWFFDNDITQISQLAGYTENGKEKVIYHQGYTNYVAFIEEAKQYIGNPDTLLVTGFSAGGFATSLLADDVIDRFSSATNVTVCVDSSLLLYDGWHETAQNLWKSPSEITERLTSNNIVLDSLTALHNKRGDSVKILFDCSVRDDTLMQYQAYIREGKMSKTKENGDLFQKDLKAMVEGLQANIEGVGIYIWEYAIDKDTKNTQHTIISSQVFEKLNGEKSVADWITDAINGDVQTYGLELLDKQY